MIAIVMSHIHSIKKTAAIELGLKFFIFAGIYESRPEEPDLEGATPRSVET
jgi:hypothetical protein